MFPPNRALVVDQCQLTKACQVPDTCLRHSYSRLHVTGRAVRTREAHMSGGVRLRIPQKVQVARAQPKRPYITAVMSIISSSFSVTRSICSPQDNLVRARPPFTLSSLSVANLCQTGGPSAGWKWSVESVWLLMLATGHRDSRFTLSMTHQCTVSRYECSVSVTSCNRDC